MRGWAAGVVGQVVRFTPFEGLIVEFSRTHVLENGQLTHGDTGSAAPGPKEL